MAEPTEMHVSLPTRLVREFVEQDGPLHHNAERELRTRLGRLLSELPAYAHALYFGCVGESGHYLWGSSGGRRPLRLRREGQDQLLGVPSSIRNEHSGKKPLVPWGLSVDGGLMPKRRPLKEGEAVLAHRDGWTALSFWDRTVDTRPGSVSVFLFNAELEFHQAVRAAMREFPTIWKRYPFEVVPIEEALASGS
jgi:hypothetical protein